MVLSQSAKTANIMRLENLALYGIRDVRYEESVWMKVRGGRGKEALYLCCVYMPTEGSAAAVIEDSYERLKEDILEYQRVVLLGDFNARVGKSSVIEVRIS